jgi:hypothetical protein
VGLAGGTRPGREGRQDDFSMTTVTRRLLPELPGATRSPREAAVRTERADAEAAEIATQSWLGLVRTWASSAVEDEHLVHVTLALAVALLEDSRPRSAQVLSRD